MAIYVGGQKYRLILNGAAYCVNVSPPYSINTSDIVMISSDGYILTDLNGIILLPQPDVPLVIENEPITTSEDYLLKDQNGYYLTLKESE